MHFFNMYYAFYSIWQPWCPGHHPVSQILDRTSFPFKLQRFSQLINLCLRSLTTPNLHPKSWLHLEPPVGTWASLWNVKNLFLEGLKNIFFSIDSLGKRKINAKFNHLKWDQVLETHLQCVLTCLAILSILTLHLNRPNTKLLIFSLA